MILTVGGTFFFTSGSSSSASSLLSPLEAASQHKQASPTKHGYMHRSMSVVWQLISCGTHMARAKPS